MALNTTKISATLNNIIAMAPVTVTYSGSNYVGTKTTNRKDVDYLEEGLRETYRFSVVLQKSDFVTLPSVMGTVVISSVTYRILNTSEDSLSVSFRLDLGEQYAG